MTREYYQAAIVGLGMIGGADPVSADALGQRVENMDGTHAGAYLKNPRIKLVAGSSRDAGRRQRFEARTGVRTYLDWREMIERESIDIVSVASYSPVHSEITTACASRGIPVIYCEKPLATRLGDAEQMLEACRRHNTLLVVNHQRRFDLNHRRLSTFLSEGQLGDLITAHVQWGTGRLGNVGTHLLDALSMITGRRFEAVSGTLDRAGRPDCRGPDFRDPGGWGVLRMERGLMATVNAADFAKGKPFHTQVVGTKGRATMTDRSVTIEDSTGRVEHWPAESGGISSMDRAVTEIVGHLDQCSPFPCAPEDAVHILEAIVGFHASHRRNSAWIDLPLSGPDREIEVLSG